MTEVGPPPNAAVVMERVDDTLQGLELDPHEASEILGFANREVPHLQTPETSYLVLGSYRDPYLRRLRIVQNGLDKGLGTYPLLLGDLPELDLDRLPTFRIRFTIVATYTDHVVAVYEQNAGGEITELGKISETPYFEKSHVLPRDYVWMTDRQLETAEDAVAAGLNVYFNDDLDHEEVEDELESIVRNARNNGVDVTYEEVLERIEERDRTEDGPVSYSWVHLNEFRLFELHGRCHPWTSTTELREATDELP